MASSNYKTTFRASTHTPDLLYTCITSDFDRFPEKRLWCEVIFRAYHDIQQYLKSSNYFFLHHAVSAQQWILSRSEDIFSFEWAVRVSFSDDNIANRIIETVRSNTPTHLPTYTAGSYFKFKETIMRTYTKRNREIGMQRLEAKLRKTFISSETLSTSILQISELEFFPPPTSNSNQFTEDNEDNLNSTALD